jgi:hypothetical protein
MSQRSRKYKKVEAFFAKVRPAAPDSPLDTAVKPSAPGTPAEDLTGWAEKMQAQPSSEDTRLESVVPPTAQSPASGRQDLIHGIDHGQKMGFTYGQEKVTSLEETPLPLPENTLRVPLMVSGTTIGIIEDAGSETDWTAKEIEIVSAVAAQLAQHLENLRLLEQNEKHTHY